MLAWQIDKQIFDLINFITIIERIPVFLIDGKFMLYRNAFLFSYSRLNTFLQRKCGMISNTFAIQTKRSPHTSLNYQSLASPPRFKTVDLYPVHFF